MIFLVYDGYGKIKKGELQMSIQINESNFFGIVFILFALLCLCCIGTLLCKDMLGKWRARRFAQYLVKMGWGISYTNATPSQFYVGEVNKKRRCVMADILIDEYPRLIYALDLFNDSPIDAEVVSTLMKLSYFPHRMLWDFMSPVFKETGYEIVKTSCLVSTNSRAKSSLSNLTELLAMIALPIIRDRYAMSFEITLYPFALA